MLSLATLSRVRRGSSRALHCTHGEKTRLSTRRVFAGNMPRYSRKHRERGEQPNAIDGYEGARETLGGFMRAAAAAIGWRGRCSCGTWLARGCSPLRTANPPSAHIRPTTTTTTTATAAERGGSSRGEGRRAHHRFWMVELLSRAEATFGGASTLYDERDGGLRTQV